jgi:hypothetical protein
MSHIPVRVLLFRSQNSIEWKKAWVRFNREYARRVSNVFLLLQAAVLVPQITLWNLGLLDPVANVLLFLLFFMFTIPTMPFVSFSARDKRLGWRAWKMRRVARVKS